MRSAVLAAGMALAAANGAQAQKTDRAWLKPGAVVVFQGDSITDGGRQRVGHDLNHTMGQDYAYILSAELGGSFPERHVTFVNRGISGNRVPDLEERWQADVVDLRPDVLSILVGVNDTLSGGEKATTAEAFEARYDALLARTMTLLPQVKIVLGQPFMLPVGKHLDSFAAEAAELRERQAAVERLAAKYHLPLVRYQDVFDAALKRAPADYWLWDGVHPTYAGHWLMAQAWLVATDAAWSRP